MSLYGPHSVSPWNGLRSSGISRGISFVNIKAMQGIHNPYWYGMIWYDLIWYDMIWYMIYGMVWYGMLCYVMLCYVMVWCGVVWCGMVWYGMVWYGMVWRDATRCDATRRDMICGRIIYMTRYDTMRCDGDDMILSQMMVLKVSHNAFSWKMLHWSCYLRN